MGLLQSVAELGFMQVTCRLDWLILDPTSGRVILRARLVDFTGEQQSVYCCDSSHRYLSKRYLPRSGA